MKTVSKKLLSLMLVAILLVSAIPFQAFADPHNPADPNHMVFVWEHNTTSHWQICPKADCDDHALGVKYNEQPHTFSRESKVCVTCGEPCPHTTTKVINKVDATCVSAGYTGDTVCAVCEQAMATPQGTTVNPTGVHTWDANYVCSVCGTQYVGKATQLTLDANTGTINGAASVTIDVHEHGVITNLPDAFKQGYSFAGWFIGGTQIQLGSRYDFTGPQTAVAKWTEKTEQLTVRRILNGDYSTAKTLLTVNVPVGTPLLTYLNTNVYGTITAELALTPGFTWQYNFWKDYSGNQPLTSQADCMNQAQTVYVNFVSNAYHLYFNANGGTVTPTSKDVYFGSPVGILPTASMSGKVFQGWKDANGTMYSAETVYQVAGDTSLTAVWKDEALVILYVYINGDFSSCNRMIVMDGFVKDNNISRNDVYAQVAKYYTPASGVLSIAGLFDEYSWGSYRSNTSKAGVPNIAVDSTHPNKLYVMVTNAVSGSTVVNGTNPTTYPNANGGLNTTPNANGTANGSVVPGTTSPLGAYWVSTGNGTGYWVYPNPNTTNPTHPTYVYINGDNPKTGDTAMIEAAAAIMVLAAAALVTVMTMRKKKMF